MKKNYDYETTLKLMHEEIPAKINKSTGEVTEVNRYVNNVPKTKSIFRQNDFSKVNNKAIKFLFDNCSKVEIAIVMQLVGLADYNSNSLKPLSDEVTVRDLADFFNISTKSVKSIFKHLYELGIYAQFKVCKDDMKEFWILSPYMSFKGKLIDDALVANFKGTVLEKYFNSKD